MKVTVYTQDPCSQCVMTKRLMKREGIEFDEEALADYPELVQQMKDEGHTQAPIVVIGNSGRHWAGFQPDLIKELKPSGAMAG